jgi:uncharacterized Fe-S radical SAM superfamily protein PflX
MINKDKKCVFLTIKDMYTKPCPECKGWGKLLEKDTWYTCYLCEGRCRVYRSSYRKDKCKSSTQESDQEKLPKTS